MSRPGPFCAAESDANRLQRLAHLGKHEARARHASVRQRTLAGLPRTAAAQGQLSMGFPRSGPGNASVTIPLHARRMGSQAIYKVTDVG